MSFFRRAKRTDIAMIGELFERFFKETKNLPGVSEIVILGKFTRVNHPTGKAVHWQLGTDPTLRVFTADITSGDETIHGDITAVSVTFTLKKPNLATEYALQVARFCQKLTTEGFFGEDDSKIRFSGSNELGNYWTEIRWCGDDVTLTIQYPLLTRRASREEGFARTGGW
jgi:hypothetical protein